jgi:hypothetical protein
MKRAFFVGLGGSVILVAITRIHFWQHVSVGYVAMPRWGSIAIVFISMLASGIAICAAKRSPPGHSLIIAILFWMLGYLAAGVLLVPFVLTIVLLGDHYNSN